MKATEGSRRGSTSCIEGAVTKSTGHLCDSPLGDGQEAAEVWVGKEVSTANAALAISAAPVVFLRESSGLLVRKHGYLYPRACAYGLQGVGICVGAYTSVRRKYQSEVARTGVANFERDFR